MQYLAVVYMSCKRVRLLVVYQSTGGRFYQKFEQARVSPNFGLPWRPLEGRQGPTAVYYWVFCAVQAFPEMITSPV